VKVEAITIGESNSLRPVESVEAVAGKGLEGDRHFECEGVELCEPCLHLQSLTRPGIIEDLLHRGGLNADIVTSGTISVGDPVTVS